MSHPFGDLLGQYLHRKHGLSQFKLANGVLLAPSVISEMCSGKRLGGPQARDRVLAIIGWLHQQEAAISIEDANALLDAARMSPLKEQETGEAELLHKLIAYPKHNPLESRTNSLPSSSSTHSDRKTSVTPSRNNLPQQLTPLIGREGEIEDVLQLLKKPECRLLTLFGQGGIGKTRLAIQAAVQIAADFPDGIVFTALQRASEPASLALAIIDAIGVPLIITDDPGARLIDFLREQKMLLLLDNFEELVSGSPENAAATLDFLTEVMKQASRVKLLVTSRVVLNLSGEWLYPVLGLTFPIIPPNETRNDVPLPEDYIRFSAIRLFIERARRVQHNFSIGEEMPGIIQICQAVDGLPLALEMAAAWTKTMSCAAIAAEIRRYLTFLETRSQDVPTRHRSIQAVINHSWQALSAEERRVYACLSVFKGGFQRKAAEQVAGATLSILSNLVDQSLLRWEVEDRYQIHELLRQFARDQLDADPDGFRSANELHCMVYADFMDQCSSGITGPHQQEVLRIITAELQNIRAAWQWAVEHCSIPALQKATYAYYEFCDFTSRYVEGAEAFELAIARVEEKNGTGLEAVSVLALLHSLLGYHYIRLGKYAHASKAFRKSQELLDAHQLVVSPGFGTDPQTGLGLLAHVTGDYSTSIQYAEAGRDASQLRNDPLNLQIACYVLANSAFALGNYQAAFAHVQQGLISTEATGNLWMTAQLLTIQGHIALAQSKYILAQNLFRESYAIKQKLDDPEGEATALNSMAMIFLLKGKPQQARELYLKSLEIFLRIHDPGGLGSTYAGLADSALAQGERTAASRYYQQGLQIAIQIKWLPLTITLLTGIGELLLQAGQMAQGATLLNKVLGHPTITENARTRARQSLERIKSQPPSRGGRPVLHTQTDEDLFQTSQSLLVELSDLAEQPARGHSHRMNEKSPPNLDLPDPLTAREIEVLQLIAQGMTNQQIAETFVLAVGTVKWYSRQIYQKLGVGNRTQAIAQARELHLLP
jgi:predicted ATPase/DNA-binding CsgD family transcriptional regulator